jgi:hypothetical protein
MEEILNFNLNARPGIRTIHILSTACIVLLVSACTGLQNGSPTPSSAAKPTEGPATPTASFEAAKIVSVTILPDVSEIKVGDTVEFRTEVQLSPGVPSPGPPPFWQIDNAAVATVTPDGSVTPLAPGQVTLSVSFRGTSATRMLRIISETAQTTNPPKPSVGPATPTAIVPTAKIISVTILPEVSEIKVGDVVEFRMEVQLSPGVPGPGPPPFWQIDNPAVAAVTAGGTLTALAPGEVTLSVRFRGASTTRILGLIP